MQFTSELDVLGLAFRKALGRRTELDGVELTLGDNQLFLSSFEEAYGCAQDGHQDHSRGYNRHDVDRLGCYGALPI